MNLNLSQAEAGAISGLLDDIMEQYEHLFTSSTVEALEEAQEIFAVAFEAAEQVSYGENRYVGIALDRAVEALIAASNK